MKYSVFLGALISFRICISSGFFSVDRCEIWNAVAKLRGQFVSWTNYKPTNEWFRRLWCAPRDGSLLVRILWCVYSNLALCQSMHFRYRIKYNSNQISINLDLCLRKFHSISWYLYPWKVKLSINFVFLFRPLHASFSMTTNTPLVFSFWMHQIEMNFGW